MTPTTEKELAVSSPKKLSARGWLVAFALTCLGLFLCVCLFNIATDPFGVFSDPVFDWYSYNMTNNPRVAKIAYLEEHYEEYNAYLLGSSGTSSFSTEGLNQLYDANFYNLFVYGNDVSDYEDMALYILEHYTADHLVLSLSLGSATDYDTETDPLFSNQHYLVDEDTNFFEFYWKYLTLNPTYGLEKIQSWQEDTLLTQPFDVFVEETGVYDKSARDIEPIGDLDTYYESYSDFLNYPTGTSHLTEIDAVLESVAIIQAACQEAGVTFDVLIAPSYIEHAAFYVEEEIEAFFTGLAELTPFWDFSLSSVSHEPRYFYDITHFRNNVGEMALGRMLGDTEMYIPDDFGTYVTSDTVATHLETLFQTESLTTEEISTQVPILMYHHFITEGEGENSAIMNIDNFEDQIKALSEAGYTTISFDELIDYVYYGTPLPENPIILTMDDGYSSNYELAFPILEEYNMKATIFVIGSSVGKDTYKDTDYAIYPHFSFEEALEMVDSSLISIQSHTYDMHQTADYEEGEARGSIVPLEGESEEDYIDALLADFTQSKTEIEEALDQEVNVLAYPKGKYTDLTQYILTQEGIKVTLGTVPAMNTVVVGLPQTLYSMNRYTMTDALSGLDLIAMLEEATSS